MSTTRKSKIKTGKIVLEKPKKPKEPAYNKMIVVNEANFGKQVADKVWNVQDEMANHIFGKIKKEVDYRDGNYGSMNTYYFSCDGSDLPGDLAFHMSVVEAIEKAHASLPDSWEKGINVWVDGYGLTIDFIMKSPPSIEYVAAEQAKHTCAMERYEAALADYNSPASIAAREEKKKKETVKITKAMQAKKAKLEKLQKEMEELAKLAKGR